MSLQQTIFLPTVSFALMRQGGVGNLPAVGLRVVYRQPQSH